MSACAQCGSARPDESRDAFCSLDCEAVYRMERRQEHRRSQFGEPLELRRDSGGFRHYLGGEPVHCGTGLEMYLDELDQPEAFVRVRYEASLGNCRREDVSVVLYTRVGEIKPDLTKASFRRPPRKERR